MKVEQIILEDNKTLRVMFTNHKNNIFHKDIPLKYDRCPNLKIAKAKKELVEEFLNTPNGRYFTKKEVLKAFAKVDDYMKSYYKELFPQGGKRLGSGRPKGTTTDKTETFLNRINQEEKEYLTQCLQFYRNLKETNPELLSKILTEKNPNLYINAPVGITGQLRIITNKKADLNN